MRLYSKKILSNRMRKETDSRVESHDGIIWQVDYDLRICYVKIQGSNQLIAAHFPNNWEKSPAYMKLGNAVRIAHMGGYKGRIEVVGNGQLVPTPVEDAQFPDYTDADVVLTGCGLIPNTPLGMSMIVQAGTYRIGGANYTLAANTPKTVTAAPSAGYYRIDIAEIDATGDITVKAGTPATSDPVQPDLDADHALCGTILVHSGMTVVDSTDINKEWQGPVVTSVNIVITDDDLDWGESSTNVRVSVYDQYGNSILEADPGWDIKLEIINGNGEVSSVEDGSSTVSVTQHTGATHNYADFTYTRNGAADDEGPTLQASLVDYPLITHTDYIVVRTEDGRPSPVASDVIKFTELIDVPHSYSGKTGQYAKVKATEDGLEFGVISGSGHVIEDEGSPLTARSKLNFVGAGVTVIDDAGNDASKVTIPGGGSGDVVGPAGAVDTDLAEFDTATGKLIKDSGISHADMVALAGLAHEQDTDQYLDYGGGNEVAASDVMKKSGGIFSGAVEPYDHGTFSNPEIVAVVYGTGSPPAANTTPIGTLWIKYIA